MSFKSLLAIKDSLPTQAKTTQKVIKSNINLNIFVSDHAAERFLQRELNNTKTSINDMKKHLIDKIASEGVVGFFDQKLQQEYVAIQKCGLFILKGTVVTTFIAPENMNSPLRNIYLKLLKKGTVEV